MINEFRGKYYFLSNFSNSKIKVNGFTFENGESAFHSFKDMNRQWDFVGLDSSTAKKKGRNVKLRHDWEEVRIINTIEQFNNLSDEEVSCILNSAYKKHQFDSIER